MKDPIEANLSGRVAVVTGANTGIGKEIARDLARLRATVILACRDEERGRAALDEIVADTGNHKTEVMRVDTSSRASIVAFGAAMAARFPAVSILVNNAGIWSNEARESVDGIELTWATNVLGYYQVTRELLPLLARGAQPGASARIVNVASEMAKSLDLDDVEMKRRGYSGLTAYAQSKQADRLLTWAFARRLAGQPITANAMHPGWINSSIASRGGGLVELVSCCAFKMFGKTTAEGADTASWLAASPAIEGISGQLWIDRQARPCRFAGDHAAMDRLWAVCEAMTAAPWAQSTSSTTLPKPSLLAT
jgi:retinol dehydrogenase-12